MPVLVFVTSNYSIEQLYADKIRTDRDGNAYVEVDKSILRQAIRRRFSENYFECNNFEECRIAARNIDFLNLKSLNIDMSHYKNYFAESISPPVTLPRNYDAEYEAMEQDYY